MSALTRPALYGLGLTVLWVLLAAANESTTYHLAPLLIAVAVPVGAALSDRIDLRGAAMAASVGLALALAGTVFLAPADRLAGPSLLPVGGAVLEAVVFAATGTIGGLAFALAKSR